MNAYFEVGSSSVTPPPVRNLGVFIWMYMSLDMDKDISHINKRCRVFNFQLAKIGKIRKYLGDDVCK